VGSDRALGIPLVLLVDDSDELRDVMARALTMSGFAVVQARDGRQAVEKARMNPPDVIVMDIWLPGIDGFTVARVLKTYAPTSHVPIVAFTADPGRVEPRSGFDAVLVKPATPEALARGIGLLLSVRSSDLRSSR
jgi:CheY-like chemotaxis protein